MAKLLCPIEMLVPKRAREYGGKAKNLAALARAGFAVPPGYALSCQAAQGAIQEQLEVQQRADLSCGELAKEPRLEAARAAVHRAPLPSAVREKVMDALRQLREGGARSFCVRSSSAVEDQKGASAAGLYRSFLNLREDEEVLQKIKEVWGSALNEVVLAYGEQLERQARDMFSVGVVIQVMVPADVSGVVFTVNPVTGDTGEVVINAAYGVAAALVDGKVSPDVWRVDKGSRALRDRVIGRKQMRAALHGDAGTIEQPVSDEQAARLCLDESAVEDLVSLALRIEKQFSAPQDIEWARAAGQLYVLQSRSVTALVPASKRRSRRRRRGEDRARIVWSNANVGEALPGVATPLTWSVLSEFSELGFRKAFGALGCAVPRDAELVGSFRGRIYLNISEFTAIASQVPGLEPETLLSLGGGGELDKLEAALEQRSSAAFFVRLPKTVLRFVKDSLHLGSKVDDFEHLFAEERSRFRALDLRIVSPAALNRSLYDVQYLLDQAGAIMLTCYGHLLWAVVMLRALLRRVAQSDAARFERELLSGLDDVESAAPGLALWHIAEIAAAEPLTKEYLMGTPASQVTLEDLPQGSFRHAMEDFLRHYGFRGVREAELIEPRWSEEPTFPIATVQLHLRLEAGEPPVELEKRQRLLRRAALAEVLERLPGIAAGPFRRLVSNAEKYMRLREQLRSRVVEVLGMFRQIALEVSRRIAKEHPELGNDSAFFLTLEELHGLLDRRLDQIDTRVARRRRQYETDRSLPDPPPSFVGYPPLVVAEVRDTDMVQGLAASSGYAEGRARVVRVPSEAAELAEDEILVVPAADVGWAPLFLVVRGVVTDLGGPLSHAAVVLREYGVPAVVNALEATRIIRSGDEIGVNGSTGEVHILRRSSENDADRA